MFDVQPPMPIRLLLQPNPEQQLLQNKYSNWYPMRNSKQPQKQPQPQISSTPQMPINPWTNKPKIRGQGLLNDILNKHLHQQEPSSSEVLSSSMGTSQKALTSQEEEILMLAGKIKEKYRVVEGIEGSMARVLGLRKRCDRIGEILEWIDKVDNRYGNQSTKNSEKSPIDSNFIYLPLHSGTVFHEILQECLGKHKNRSIGEPRNTKLKKYVQQLKQVSSIDYIGMLDQNIL